MKKFLDAKSIVRYGFECYSQKNMAGILTLIDENSEFIIPGNPEIIPWAGEYRGHKIIEFCEITAATIDYKQFTVHSYYNDHNVVIVMADEECLVKSTGKTFKNSWVGIVTVDVEKGKWLKYVEYSDTAAMEAAFKS